MRSKLVHVQDCRDLIPVGGYDGADVVCCRYRTGYAGRLVAVGYTFAGEVGGAALGSGHPWRLLGLRRRSRKRRLRP